MANNSVALTSSMRSNLLSLKVTQNTFSKTQEKLSSGYKVTSAMDNPSSYFTAQTLNTRATDLSTLLDGIGQAISTLETADKGIETLQSFVEQAKTVANSARDTQNIASTTTSEQKFDTDRLHTLGLDQQVTDIKATDELIIRSGKSTELVGTATISEDADAKSIFTQTAFVASAWDGDNVTAATKGAGSIKVGKDEYFLDFGASAYTENKMVETTLFKVGDRLKIISHDSTEKLVVAEDSNGKRHTVDISGINGTALENISALSEGTELVCQANTSITSTFHSEASNHETADVSVLTGTNWHVTKVGNGAFGADVKTESAVQLKKGQTVGQVFETMQYFIGDDKVNISFENGNVAIRSTNTASIEVKDSSASATTDLATKFGLDKGTTIKMTDPTTDTAEALRQKIASIDGLSVEFDETGHLVIKNLNGDDMVMSGKLAERLGLDGAVTNGSNERGVYAEQFNGLLTQIDELVDDSTYKGINLLKGDSLTVNFNESRTSMIELKGVTFNANGLGLTQAANRWVDNTSIDKSLNQIIKATSLLRTQASEFGQNLSVVQIREDFTQNMINNLQSGADKLVLADMNEEAANMLALQTRQQLGTNSLSLASQASQSVLRLF